MIHTPVLQKEIIQYLDVQPNRTYIDATFGMGGHSKAILDKGANVLAIEWDSEIVRKNDLALTLVNDSYVNIKRIAGNMQPDGILFDLGMCSWHLESSGRGFSFLRDELLDMRFSSENTLTAEKIVNTWKEPDLVEMLKQYGEERYAKRIAREIVKNRMIRTTSHLADIIKRAVPKSNIHPATRTFQALRIAVNDELNNLSRVLPDAVEILKNNGRLVVISFHSLEDRIVKRFIKASSLEPLFKKPITPSQGEISNNPRSRSAKLRAAVKIYE